MGGAVPPQLAKHAVRRPLAGQLPSRSVPSFCLGGERLGGLARDRPREAVGPKTKCGVRGCPREVSRVSNTTGRASQQRARPGKCSAKLSAARAPQEFCACTSASVGLSSVCVCGTVALWRSALWAMLCSAARPHLHLLGRGAAERRPGAWDRGSQEPRHQEPQEGG
jgi:hypothetical protein